MQNFLRVVRYQPFLLIGKVEVVLGTLEVIRVATVEIFIMGTPAIVGWEEVSPPVMKVPSTIFLVFLAKCE